MEVGPRLGHASPFCGGHWMELPEVILVINIAAILTAVKTSSCTSGVVLYKKPVPDLI